jgi:hypothetical protein
MVLKVRVKKGGKADQTKVKPCKSPASKNLPSFLFYFEISRITATKIVKSRAGLDKNPMYM